MESKLLKVWEKSRDSAEHFDKTLADFRKIIFSVNAASAPIALQIWRRSPLHLWRVQISGLVLLGLTINVINVLMWFLEKHYHVYLLASASVASKAEEQLDLAPELRLTARLSAAKNRTSLLPKGISYYDFIYWLPAIAGLIPLCLEPRPVLHTLLICILIMETVVIIWKLYNQFNLEPHYGKQKKKNS